MTDQNKHAALLVIVLGFSLLAILFREWKGWEDWVYMLYAALGIGVLSLLIPPLGTLVVKGWFKLAEILGYVNGRIILSVVFFVFLFPIAVLYRMFHKNALQRKRTKGGSMFVERNHKYEPKDLENIW